MEQSETTRSRSAVSSGDPAEPYLEQICTWVTPRDIQRVLLVCAERASLTPAGVNCWPTAQVETASEIGAGPTQGTPPYDLIICWYPAQWQEHVDALPAKLAPLLAPGGRLAIVDLLAPGRRLRGKRGRQWRDAGVYFNALLSLRNGHPTNALSIHEWQDALIGRNFVVEQQVTRNTRVELSYWSARLQPPDSVRLQAMLRQAPEKVQEFLTPQFGNARIDFCLSELILVARLGTAD